MNGYAPQPVLPTIEDLSEAGDAAPLVEARDALLPLREAAHALLKQILAAAKATGIDDARDELESLADYVDSDILDHGLTALSDRLDNAIERAEGVEEARRSGSGAGNPSHFWGMKP